MPSSYSSDLNRNSEIKLSLMSNNGVFEKLETRMHSSRMRTARSLTVSRSIRWRGVACPGGVCAGGGGMRARGGTCVTRKPPPPVDRILDTRFLSIDDRYS